MAVRVCNFPKLDYLRQNNVFKQYVSEVAQRAVRLLKERPRLAPEHIGNMLGLNMNAGLGWRLSKVTTITYDSRSCTYYLAIDDPVEAITLPEALNMLARTSPTRFASADIV